MKFDEKIFGVKVSEDSRTVQIIGAENIETFSIADEFKDSKSYYVDSVKTSFKVVELPKGGLTAKFMQTTCSRVFYTDLEDPQGVLTDWCLFTQYVSVSTSRGVLEIRVAVKVRVKKKAHLNKRGIKLYQVEESKRV